MKKTLTTILTVLTVSVAASASTVTGRITCDGTGVAGVPVSDGIGIVVTDSLGRYSITGDMPYGTIFYTLPGGYEPETEDNGFQTKIFAHVDGDRDATHDFVLRRVDNDRHLMVVGADSHLARRLGDLEQFDSLFVRPVRELAAANSDKKIYSTILGDLTWDQFWTTNDYGLSEFVGTMTGAGYPLMLFPVIGNHDNDPSVPAGDDTDLQSSEPFRQAVAPSFYSFNLGKVHYVVLDDVVYRNDRTEGRRYKRGVAGNRNYERRYTDDQLDWLRRDLALVADKSAPLVIMFHVPAWRLDLNDDRFATRANLADGSSEALAEIVSDFDNVTLLSGHTHYNYHAHPADYPNIHENNVAAICATWWWTGHLSDRHICVDGSPGGFALYDVDGKTVTSEYIGADRAENNRFRVYDMNTVRDYYRDEDAPRAMLEVCRDRTDYALIADNTVYVNVFDYDTDWRVEIFEGDSPLEVHRIVAEDPLHTLAYDIPMFALSNKVPGVFSTTPTSHIFEAVTVAPDTPVTVRVTDGRGRVFTETVVRPRPFDINLGIKQQ